MYRKNVEKIFILCKVLQFFGFVLYPDMHFSECTPNKPFKEKESGLPFPVFTEHMFKKWKTFKLSVAPTEHEIEESTADLTDLMSVEEEEFEVGNSKDKDKDKDLEFIDSFV